MTFSALCRKSSVDVLKSVFSINRASDVERLVERPAPPRGLPMLIRLKPARQPLLTTEMNATMRRDRFGSFAAFHAIVSAGCSLALCCRVARQSKTTTISVDYSGSREVSGCILWSSRSASVRVSTTALIAPTTLSGIRSGGGLRIFFRASFSLAICVIFFFAATLRLLAVTPPFLPEVFDFFVALAAVLLRPIFVIADPSLSHKVAAIRIAFRGVSRNRCRT